MEKPVPGTFEVTAYRCRCGHEWVPNKIRSEERPRVCPRCRSPRWDLPYLFNVRNGRRVPPE